MLKVEFEYRDNFSKSSEWNKDFCIVSCVEECKSAYGLGLNSTCEYRIISITKA